MVLGHSGGKRLVKCAVVRVGEGDYALDYTVAESGVSGSQTPTSIWVNFEGKKKNIIIQ